MASLIRNTNTKSSDYDELRRVPRPGHADYVANMKFHGAQDVSGGGHFSGRLTAPLCIAGGIAIQLLRDEGVEVGAHIARIAGIADDAFALHGLSSTDVHVAHAKTFPVLNDAQGERMIAAIAEAREAGDSVGGIVECAATGMPVGVGEPMFDGVENAVARMLFGIPAVKGVEFGEGFGFASLRGSQANDPYAYDEKGAVVTTSNHNGGVTGGITNGMPLLCRVVIKPTSSIGQKQRTVDLETGREAELIVKGRHDPCIVPRAVPVVEAALALGLLDLLESEACALRP